MRRAFLIAFVALPAFAQRIVSISPMIEPRAVYTTTLLHDGRVLIAGGGNGLWVYSSMELYDPVAHRFTPAGDMRMPRTQHAATLLPDGRVLMTSGEIGNGEATISAEICDPLGGTCAFVAPPRFDHRQHGAFLVSPTKVLLWGGWGSSAELYDTVIDSWTTIEPPAAEQEYDMSVTPLGDGRVIMIGGVHGDAPTARVRLFDPATESIRDLPPISMPRAAHRAALLPDGTLLVVGGFTTPFPVSSETCTAEIYDPRTGSSHPAGNISPPCFAPQITPLASGKVLVTQYIDTPAYGNAHAVVELFDPQRGAFVPLPGVNGFLMSTQTTLLDDGTVLITGGGFAGNYASLFFPSARGRAVSH